MKQAKVIRSHANCCPKCKGATYSLEGYFDTPFTSEVTDRNEVKENLDDDGYRVMQARVCPACYIRWLLN